MATHGQLSFRRSDSRNFGDALHRGGNSDANLIWFAPADNKMAQSVRLALSTRRGCLGYLETGTEAKFSMKVDANIEALSNMIAKPSTAWINIPTNEGCGPFVIVSMSSSTPLSNARMQTQQVFASCWSLGKRGRHVVFKAGRQRTELENCKNVRASS